MMINCFFYLLVFLRRGRPQFLNQKRYDDIVKLWLQHNIPVYVGRKLEATYDCGGWETM